MIEAIEPRGILIREATVPGETRAEDVFPAHPNGIPVSRDRWLLVYATRTFRGVDDDLSILYQLRAGAPDGRLLHEGMLARSVNDWDALGDGGRYVKQHGHPVAFGVPRGTRIGGRPAPSANLFVVKWRRCARAIDPATGLMIHGSKHPELHLRTQAVEWMQLRLNEAGDDVEVVQPPALLVQQGYEAGPGFCARVPSPPPVRGLGPVRWMNQSFTQAVPFNDDATEWADCNHFDGGRIAALKYRYDAGQGRYAWVETGPVFQDAGNSLSEASLARYGDDWIVCARSSPPSGQV